MVGAGAGTTRATVIESSIGIDRGLAHNIQSLAYNRRVRVSNPLARAANDRRHEELVTAGAGARAWDICMTVASPFGMAHLLELLPSRSCIEFFLLFVLRLVD